MTLIFSSPLLWSGSFACALLLYSITLVNKQRILPSIKKLSWAMSWAAWSTKWAPRMRERLPRQPMHHPPSKSIRLRTRPPLPSSTEPAEPDEALLVARRVISAMGDTLMWKRVVGFPLPLVAEEDFLRPPEGAQGEVLAAVADAIRVAVVEEAATNLATLPVQYHYIE